MWVIIKASHFSKSATLDGPTHLLNFKIEQCMKIISVDCHAAFIMHFGHFRGTIVLGKTMN